MDKTKQAYIAYKGKKYLIASHERYRGDECELCVCCGNVFMCRDLKMFCGSFSYIIPFSREK